MEVHEKITCDSKNTIQTTTGLVTNTAEKFKPRQEWRPLGERLYTRRQDWPIRHRGWRVLVSNSAIKINEIQVRSTEVSTVFCCKQWVDAHINASGHSVVVSLSDVRARHVARISWPRYNDHSIKCRCVVHEWNVERSFICAPAECHSFRLNRLNEKLKNETFTTHTSLCVMYGKVRDLPVINWALLHEGMRKMGGTVPVILYLGTWYRSSGRFQASATVAPVPTKEEAGYASVVGWTILRRELSLAPVGNRIPFPRSSST